MLWGWDAVLLLSPAPPIAPQKCCQGGDPRTGTGQASKQALRFLLPTRPLMRGHVPFQHFPALSGAVADGAGAGPLIQAAITLREQRRAATQVTASQENTSPPRRQESSPVAQEAPPTLPRPGHELLSLPTCRKTGASGASWRAENRRSFTALERGARQEVNQAHGME